MQLLKKSACSELALNNLDLEGREGKGKILTWEGQSGSLWYELVGNSWSLKSGSK